MLVRAGSALGKEGALRVTYGTCEENARFLEALEEVLAGARSSSPPERPKRSTCGRPSATNGCRGP